MFKTDDLNNYLIIFYFLLARSFVTNRVPDFQSPLGGDEGISRR